MTTPPIGKPILTSDLCRFIRDWLSSYNYTGPEGWRVTEGPDSQKRAGMEICVSASPGGGLTHEDHLEMLSWQIKVYGPQSRNDTDNRSANQAERMAWILDRMMITMEQSGMVIAEKRIVSSQRFGSPPAGMPKDRAGRASYVATYVWEVESGL